MPLSYFLEKTRRHDLEKFRRKMEFKDLREKYVAFSGTPRKHPTDQDKVLLVVDPFSTHATYYEFLTEDIVYAEEIANLVAPEGETVTLVRVWVRKKAIAVHCTPFLVDQRSE